MIPDYGYPEFKRKLCSNPKWIVRGLTVVAYSPDIATPKDIQEILRYLRVIENNGQVCPAGVDITRTRPAVLVRKHAPDIYRFYRKQFAVPETTS